MIVLALRRGSVGWEGEIGPPSRETPGRYKYRQTVIGRRYNGICDIRKKRICARARSRVKNLINSAPDIMHREEFRVTKAITRNIPAEVVLVSSESLH